MSDERVAEFSLKLLGRVRLVGPEGPLSGRIVQRRQLALLARLAGAPNSSLSRDKLIGALWPETDNERARHLLNDSVYVVRKSLGEEAIVSAGEELRLEPDVVGSDVHAFRRALASRELERALALYRGPFMDGFFYPGSDEFERWSSQTRARLEREALEAAWALVEEREAERPAEAVRWARRALSIDPTHEPALRRLIQILDRLGDRAGASRAYEVFAEALEREIGVEPAPETQALAEAIRSRSTPRSKPSEEPPASEPVPELAAGAEDPAPEPSPDATRPLGQHVGVIQNGGGQERDLRRWGLAGSLTLLAFLIGALLMRSASPGPSPAPASGKPRIAVLPFENLGPGEANDFLSDGVTNDIITRLAQTAELKVLSRTSVQQYENTREGLPEIARTLGASHVLEGTLQRNGDRIRITAQLIDAATDEHLWAASYDRTIDNLLAVQSDVAARIAGALPGTLSPEVRQRLAKRPTADPEAWILYLRGRHIWNQRGPENLERSIRYFERAIARDSTFAAAYAGLADAHWLLGWNGYWDEERAYRIAEAAARRALELDPSLAEAHTTMAWVPWNEGSWPEIERMLTRAIELDPSYATARHWYSHLLVGMGRLEEAVEQIRRAQDLDPLSPVIAENVGDKLYYARRYPAAIEAYRRTLELNPERPWLHVELARIHTILGRLEEARELLRTAIDLGADQGYNTATFRAQLAGVEAQAGRHDRALALLSEAESGGASPFALAIAYIALGDDDRAFELLERVEWKYPAGTVLADPRLDPVRRDPRFLRLSAEIDRRVGVR